MMFVSTRSDGDLKQFDDTLLSALASDGGLYLPAGLPSYSVERMRELQKLGYCDLAGEILPDLLGSSIPRNDLKDLISSAYAEFDHSAIAPLKSMQSGIWLLELFHGPTLAFKDFALQLLCRILDYKLSQRGERALIIGATSGDTGSAAIHACKSVKAVDLFMLHPKGRVSDVQRRQMTTVSAPNIHNFAVDGTFDDCQTAVKALLNDPDLNRVQHVTAVNSVNWTRVAAQVVYYFYAGLALGAPDRKIDFVVPTGNFGNIYAGHVARKMGLSVGNLTIASNRNDILTRFFEDSSMKTQQVQPSLTPSMDIQNSSNFERLLFELLDGSGANVAQLMQTFKETGEFSVSAEVISKARDLFSAVRVSDDETKAEMARIFLETSEIVDPHTAVGLAAARQSLSSADNPMVVLGTAHPAKFPDAVMAATGRIPDVPESLQILQGREEFVSDIANDIDVLKGEIMSTLQNS